MMEWRSDEGVGVVLGDDSGVGEAIVAVPGQGCVAYAEALV